MYKLTKSLIFVKSIIYKVNKVSSIVIRGTSTIFFFKKTHKTYKTHKIHTKIKSNNYFLVTFVYFHLLLVI